MPATARWTLLWTVLSEAVSATPPRAGFGPVAGPTPAYAMSNIRALARGAAAPLRSPRKTPAPAAFAVTEFRPASAWLSVRGGRSPDFLLPTPDHRPSRPSRSRVSLRRDRRAAWSALPPLRRRSPPASGTDSARPSAGVERPSQPSQGPGVRGVGVSRRWVSHRPLAVVEYVHDATPLLLGFGLADGPAIAVSPGLSLRKRSRRDPPNRTAGTPTTFAQHGYSM